MAGHSKWANIKHKKMTNDKKKSKLFSKIINNIEATLKTNLSDKNVKKNAINLASNNNISKKKILKIINKIEKSEKKESLLTFKNNQEIYISINIINDEKIKSEIKYIMSNSLFKIQENMNNIATIKKQINIKEQYNEAIIYNLIKNLQVNDLQDSSITTDEDNIIKIKNIIKNIIKTNTVAFIDYNEKKNIEKKQKKQITNLLENLKKNKNIKNIFTNVI